MKLQLRYYRKGPYNCLRPKEGKDYIVLNTFDTITEILYTRWFSTQGKVSDAWNLKHQKGWFQVDIDQMLRMREEIITQLQESNNKARYIFEHKDVGNFSWVEEK